MLLCAAVAATVGLAATGTVYGVLATGLRARDTLVPLLVLPAVTPVMLGGSAGVRGRARRLELRRVAVGAAARGVLGARVRGGHDGVRPAAGGIVNARPARAGSARRWSSRSAITAVFALWVSPPDAEQGDVVRLLYLHVPTIWIAFLGFFVTAVASVLWLVPRTRRTEWDLLAGASAEVGVVFTGITLIVGSIWGRPDVGHLLGVGRAAHHHRDPLLPVPRLPRAAAHRRRPPTSAASGARSRR